MPFRFRCLAVPVFAFALLCVPSTCPAQAQNAEIDSTWQSLHQWEKALQSDLIAEKFDGLETTATHLRSEKTRVPGGEWQLRLFYSALNAPEQSEQDSLEHITHLEHWMSQRPNSITARVALATALVRWAWVARGHGYGNTVTQEGWKLFRERVNEAQVILEGSAKMTPMCPQWYSAMMMVGTAQGWDQARMHQLLENGIKLEPGYYYLYQQYANYLLPKWHGRPGDASNFAAASADSVGGNKGDIVYYQISANLIKRGDNEFPPHELNWQRIQRGYQALVAEFGPDYRLENELAFMAWRIQDPTVGQRQFEVIGEKWSRSVWGSREDFDRARDWSRFPTKAPLPGQPDPQRSGTGASLSPSDSGSSF